MPNYRKRLEEEKALYNRMLGAKNTLVRDITNINFDILTNENRLADIQKTQHLLNIVSNNAREQAKQLLEQTVTAALNFVFTEPCRFEIELTTLRGKPACEFYVVTIVNGEESRQKPQDACGGGFVDIIATALRYAYINIFNDPYINNGIALDEPGKMVDELSVVKFAEFIKSLGNSFNRQTIMITHNDAMVSVADKVTMVNKVNDTSVVQDYNFGGTP